MAKLINETSHTSLQLSRQEANEVIGMLAQELANNETQDIVLPLGLDDASEDLVIKNQIQYDEEKCREEINLALSHPEPKKAFDSKAWLAGVMKAKKIPSSKKGR